MKEIPILFSTPMVQAILEGRKTQTRRLAAIPVHDHFGTDIMDWGLSKHPYLKDGKWLFDVQSDVDDHATFELKPKYGKPGDVLWVRESWQLKGWDFDGMMTVKYATGETRNCEAHDPTEDSEWLINHVDKLEKRGYIKRSNKDSFVFTDKKQPFCPSIHMPKEAARIWLQVENVRVERLQDISDADALAEGIEWKIKFPDEYPDLKYYRDYEFKDRFASGIGFMPRHSFFTLWQSINGAESWQANPFVWAISFKVLSTTGRPDLKTIKSEV